MAYSCAGTAITVSWAPMTVMMFASKSRRNAGVRNGRVSAKWRLRRPSRNLTPSCRAWRAP